MPGPDVREAYNGRESRKEGERNGRGCRKGRGRDRKLPLLLHGGPRHMSRKVKRPEIDLNQEDKVTAEGRITGDRAKDTGKVAVIAQAHLLCIHYLTTYSVCV